MVWCGTARTPRSTPTASRSTPELPTDIDGLFYERGDAMVSAVFHSPLEAALPAGRTSERATLQTATVSIPAQGAASTVAAPAAPSAKPATAVAAPVSAKPARDASFLWL